MLQNWGFRRLTPAQKKMAVSKFDSRPDRSPLDSPLTASMRMWRHKDGLHKESTSKEIDRVARHEDGMARKKKVLGTRRRKTETPPSEENDDADAEMWSEDGFDAEEGQRRVEKLEVKMEVDEAEGGAQDASQLAWAPPPPPGAFPEVPIVDSDHASVAEIGGSNDAPTEQQTVRAFDTLRLSSLRQHPTSPSARSPSIHSRDNRFSPYNLQHRRASCPSVPCHSQLRPNLDLQTAFHLEAPRYAPSPLDGRFATSGESQAQQAPPSPFLHSSAEQSSSIHSSSPSPSIDLERSPPSPPYIYPPPRPPYHTSLTAPTCGPFPPPPTPSPIVSSAFAELEERRRSAATAMERATLYAPRDSLGSASGSGSGEDSQSQNHSQSSQELKRQMKRQAAQQEQGGRRLGGRGGGGGGRALVPKESWGEYCPPPARDEGLFPGELIVVDLILKASLTLIDPLQMPGEGHRGISTSSESQIVGAERRE